MTTQTYAPDLIPSLCYDDVPAAIEYLERVVGFERHLIVPGKDGTIAHCELRLGRGILMCGDSKAQSPGSNWRTPGALDGRTTSGVYVAVPDIEARYERARAAGATITAELHDTDYGSRDFAIVDCGGHRWSFGTYHPLADRPGDDNAGEGMPPELYVGCRYDDAPRAIAFFRDAFGASEHFETGDGATVHHAQLRFGSSLYMLGSSRDDGYLTWTPAKTGGAVTQQLYAVVSDVDAHFARAHAAGAAIERPPFDTEYGSRAYVARDPEGHVWTFGTYRPAAAV